MTHEERTLIFLELRQLYDEFEARQWLELPHPQLDGRRALDCEYREVIAIIDRLKSGAFL